MSSLSGSDLFEDTQEHKTHLITDSGSDLSLKPSAHQKISHSSRVPYAATILPSEAGIQEAQRRLSMEVATNSLNKSSLPMNATVVICTQPPAHKEKEEPEDVTEDFIKEFNRHRGNAENLAKARRMLKNTRLLGGMIPSASKIDIDVPSARRNFFLLTGIDNLEVKMSALENLIQLLLKDEIKQETAFDLVSLAINLMNQMDRELMQTQVVDEQSKICQAYGIVTELIQRHYAKKHLGGITFELKNQLIHTAKTLEELNTHGDLNLHFHVKFALEGIKRLRDDRKELFELFERLFHLLISAGALYAEDMSTFSAELDAVFKGLDIRLTHSWYDGAILFNEFSKLGTSDNVQLLIMQGMVREKVDDLDWKFLYNAIGKFGEIAINGELAKIRKAALEGQKVINANFPGILDFIDFKSYRKKASMSPLVHFKLPICKDNNVTIRQHCAETLIKIAKLAPDKHVRKKAKNVLLIRQKQEKDNTILALLNEIIPKKIENQKAWISEIDSYEWTAPKKIIEHEDEIKLDVDKADNDTQSISQYATQILHGLPQNHMGSHEGSNLIIVSPIGTPVSTPSHSPPATPRPSTVKSQQKIATILSEAFGISPGIFKQAAQEIHLHGEEEIHINSQALHTIFKLIEIHREKISKLDFSHCEIDKQILLRLLDYSKTLPLESLILKTSLSHSSSKMLAALLAENTKLKVSLNRSEDYLLVGLALSKKDQINDAILFYQAGLMYVTEATSDKTKFKLCFKLGKLFLKTGKDREASIAFKEALKIDSSNFNAAFELGKSYLNQKKTKHALKFAEKALSLRPEDLQAKELLEAVKKMEG